MKRLSLLLIVAAIGGAYIAGYWPEHRARVADERSLDSMRAELEHLAARNRLCGLQAQLVDLLATVEARDYGTAQTQTSTFFDAVRAETRRHHPDDVATALERILAQRDAATIAITHNDPAAGELFRGALTRLRAVLGEAPRRPTSTSSTSPSPPAIP